MISLRQRVFNVIRDVSPSIPWVMGRQNAPRHVKPYGTIELRILTGTSSPAILPVDENGVQLFRFNVNFNVEINVYGVGAYEMALQAAMMMSTPDGIGAAYRNAMWTRGIDAVYDLTEVVGDSEQFEERGMADIRMHGLIEIPVNTGIIERVVVSGKALPWSLQMDLTNPEGIPDDIGDWLSGLGTIPNPAEILEG